MEIRTGKDVKIQHRPVKESDPEWADYQEQLEAWEQKKDDLEEAITYVLALRDYPIPENPLPKDYSVGMKMLIDEGLYLLPENKWLRKLAWLRDSVIGQHDEYNINLIIQKLSGVPEDIIEEMKKNFRDTLLGKTSHIMAQPDDDGSGATE